MNTTGTSVIQEQQELDGLISQARIQYGKVCANQHELGITLLKLRDATKAQGNRAGKGFEACLAEIGISKTQAYRFIHAAETGQPVDYDNAPTSSRNATTLPPNAEPEDPEPFHWMNAMGDLRSLVDKTIASWPPEAKHLAPIALRDLADVLDLEERRMRRDAICMLWRWRNTFEWMLSERLAECDDPNLEVDYAELARVAILQVTEEPWHCDKELLSP
jgi:hypothetical protein